MPDVNILESLLQQLHYDSTSVSFLMIGSSYHPHCNFGYVPYRDILHFIATATFGFYAENYYLNVSKPFNYLPKSRFKYSIIAKLLVYPRWTHHGSVLEVKRLQNLTQFESVIQQLMTLFSGKCLFN